MKHAIGLLGTKRGQTQIYDDAGRRLPVTVVEAGPCIVLQKKTPDHDGYSALQVAFGQRRGKNIPLPERGHLAKAGIGPTGGKKRPQERAKRDKERKKEEKFADYPRVLKEFRIPAEELDSYEVGQEIRCEIFEVGQKIDVTGTSKGKGFAGVIKRHHFGGTRATHGTHETFRHGGSIGQKEFPAKVWKGRKMAGQLGNKQVTVHNLEVVRVMPEDNLVLIKGAVPGSRSATVILRPTAKA